MKKFLNQKKVNPDIAFASIIFIFLSIYLLLRANSIYLSLDEIETKWTYMVSLNFLPYQGYIDANNHFLNSFLGGLFIRLFNSDSNLVIRLPNLLSFPLYFWSVYALRKYFNNKSSFYLILVLLSFTPFILEYFGMARGYGMSMAFLVFAIQQKIEFFRNNKTHNFILSGLSWVMAVYSNLTLIPFAIMGLFYLAIYLWKLKKPKLYLIIIVLISPIIYAVKYSFHLQEIGKLYLGSESNFIDTTIHSLSKLLWDSSHIFIDIILIIMAIFIFYFLFKELIKSLNLFNPKIVFPIFFLAGIVSIFLQNRIFGVNFPEERAALYLVLFFFAALCFSIDYFNIRIVNYILLFFGLLWFALNMNQKYFVSLKYEFINKHFFSLLPDSVNGHPPSTGFYTRPTLMAEISRSSEIPYMGWQKASTTSDTLSDYIIAYKDMRPDLSGSYHVIFKDKISSLKLYQRNKFLVGTKIDEREIIINGSDKYFGIYSSKANKPLLFRCSGFIENINIDKSAIIVINVTDSTKKSHFYYQGLDLAKSCKPDKDGKITFDFTFTLNNYTKSNKASVYFYNNKKADQNGEIKLEVYEI